MRERLATLDPEAVDIRDESGQHVGHDGAKDGGGHYQLVIVSPRFRGLRAVARHRLVYDTLGDLMKRDIHALAIQAYAPEEL